MLVQQSYCPCFLFISIFLRCLFSNLIDPTFYCFRIFIIYAYDISTVGLPPDVTWPNAWPMWKKGFLLGRLLAICTTMLSTSPPWNMSVIPITTSGIPVDVKLKKNRSTETFQSEALKPFTDLTHIRQNINVAAEQIFVILIIDDCSPKAKLIDLVQIYNFKLTSAVCVRTKHTRKLTKVQNINITWFPWDIGLTISLLSLLSIVYTSIAVVGALVSQPISSNRSTAATASIMLSIWRRYLS